MSNFYRRVPVHDTQTEKGRLPGKCDEVYLTNLGNNYLDPYFVWAIPGVMYWYEEVDLKSKWISVNTKLPKQKTHVLVYAPNCNIIGSVLLGMFFKGNKSKGWKPSWTVYDFSDSKLDELVTHWMQLPKPPAK